MPLVGQLAQLRKLAREQATLRERVDKSACNAPQQKRSKNLFLKCHRALARKPLCRRRDTVRTVAWQAGTRALMEKANVVALRTQEGGSIVTSVLLKADK